MVMPLDDYSATLLGLARANPRAHTHAPMSAAARRKMQTLVQWADYGVKHHLSVKEVSDLIKQYHTVDAMLDARLLPVDERQARAFRAAQEAFYEATGIWSTDPQELTEAGFLAPHQNPSSTASPFYYGRMWHRGAPSHEAQQGSRIQLVNVPRKMAFEFNEKHHSKLPKANYRGLFYAIGAVVDGELVAVALAGTPSGAIPDPDRVLELSRIASDGTVKGVASKLAARILDLLPESGRNGRQGTLLVTYSLLEEAATVYLALASKGFRPTRLVKREVPHGVRRKSGQAARPSERKIRWEAGPDAAPPRWDLLAHTAALPAQVEGAKKEFAEWQRRMGDPSLAPIRTSMTSPE